jgi:hypothetical protein
MPPPPKPKLSQWTREREREPFDAAAWNRFPNWANGFLAAPLQLINTAGGPALSWNPAGPSFTIRAPVGFYNGATLIVETTTDNDLRLANARWLSSWNQAHAGPVNLIGANPSNWITIGSQPLQPLQIMAPLANNTGVSGLLAGHGSAINLFSINSTNMLQLGQDPYPILILSPLANGIPVNARNGAGSANIAMLVLDGSNIIHLGAATARLSVDAPLVNATTLTGRNAANSANVTLLGLNASNQVVLGQAAVPILILSPLANATKLSGRNAANTADVALIGLTAADVVEVGATLSLTPTGARSSGYRADSLVIAPAISSNQHDYAPTGIQTATVLQISSTVSCEITGFAAGQTVAGHRLDVFNAGAQNVVFKHETGSAGSNRINTPTGADFTLLPARGVPLFWNGARWRMLIYT